jgi:predicted transcriptional regulator
MVATRVTPDLRRKLQAIAKAEDRPLSSVVRRALQAALAQRQASAPPSDEWEEETR